MVPARFGQAAAPFLFAVLMERYGASALLLSTALGLAGLPGRSLRLARGALAGLSLLLLLGEQPRLELRL